jgi:FKBP-type peptidyl-prolyl cis-trans isomerase (trigger factor)
MSDQSTTAPVIKRLKQGRIECSITFSKEDVLRSEDAVIQKRGQNISAKGFRAGHAPKEVVREQIGADQILSDTIRTLLPNVLPNILKEHNLKPIVPPSISVTSQDPLSLTLIFVEHPEVSMGKIGKITKKDKPVDESEVQRVIEYTLKQYNQKELTDEFVKEKLGGTTVAALKEEILSNLKQQAEQHARFEQEQALLDEIRKAVKVEIAPEILEEEYRLLKEEFLSELQRANLSVEDWLKQTNKKFEDVDAGFRTQAEGRVKVRFGMEKLIEDQKIEISDDDVLKAFSGIKKEDPQFEQARWRLTVNKVMDSFL